MVSFIKVSFNNFYYRLCLISENQLDQLAWCERNYISFDDTVLKKNLFSIPRIPGSFGLTHMSKNMSAPKNKLARMKIVIIILYYKYTHSQVKNILQFAPKTFLAIDFCKNGYFFATQWLVSLKIFFGHFLSFKIYLCYTLGKSAQHFFTCLKFLLVVVDIIIFLHSFICSLTLRHQIEMIEYK